MAGHYLGHACSPSAPGIRTGMPIKIDNPRELGADRLVNAVAAFERSAARASRWTSAPR